MSWWIISDPPKPVLKLLSSWLDVFEKEHLEFHCDGSSSEWTFSWYKDEKELLENSDVDLNENGSVLKITSVSLSHQGKFACKAHHKSRGVTSGFSNTADVKVYGEFIIPFHDTRCPVLISVYFSSILNNFFFCKLVNSIMFGCYSYSCSCPQYSYTKTLLAS